MCRPLSLGAGYRVLKAGGEAYPQVMTRRHSQIAVALLTAVVAVAAFAAPASAEVNPAKFDQAQVGLTYTVYVPTTALGLKATSFQLTDCGPGPGGKERDAQIDAAFGKDWIGGGNKGSIAIAESYTGCFDGPDEVGLVTTFTAHGATATIFGSCKGGKSTCTKSTPALLRKGQGYTTVTLPAVSSALKSTYVEVYTTKMSVKDIKKFVTGLEPVN